MWRQPPSSCAAQPMHSDDTRLVMLCEARLEVKTMQALRVGQRVRVAGPFGDRGFAPATILAINPETETATVTLELGFPGRTISVPLRRISPLPEDLEEPMVERKELAPGFEPRERARLGFVRW